MKFTYDDQLAFADLALKLTGPEEADPKSLEAILDVGELIKKYADSNNAPIFDTTEYIYELIRRTRGEEGADEQIVSLRKEINQSLHDSLGQSL